MPPKTRKSTSKTATTPCGLCCNALKDGEDILCCSGPCKSQVHRYCAAVTVSHFRSLQTNSSPFTCLFCTQTAFKTTVECLQSEIDKLRADVDKLKEAPEVSRERQEVAPRVPPWTTRELLPSPTKPSVQSERSLPPILLPLLLLFYQAPLLYLALNPPMLELVSLFLTSVQVPGLELEPKLMVPAEFGVQWIKHQWKLFRMLYPAFVRWMVWASNVKG